MNGARTLIVVLGMHRSGTSALTGVVNKLGVSAGKGLIGANKSLRFNPRGTFEKWGIAKIHNALLNDHGESWCSITPLSPSALNAPEMQPYRNRLTAILNEEFGDSKQIFVVKDPRMCRLLPFWFPVLKELSISPRFIHIFRNPKEVAASLASRDGLDENVTQLLWLMHVLDAERDTRGYPRTFLTYGHLLGNWRTCMERVGREIGVRWPTQIATAATEIDAFLSISLRTHSSGESIADVGDMHPFVREAARLASKLADGKRWGMSARFDRLRIDAERAIAMVAPFLDGLGRKWEEDTIAYRKLNGTL